MRTEKYIQAYKIFNDAIGNIRLDKFWFSNETDRSIKGISFFEILKFDPISKNHVVYSNDIKGSFQEVLNRITTENSEDLDMNLSQMDILNDKRTWMMDLQVVYYDDPERINEAPGENILYFPFKRAPTLKAAFNKVTTINAISTGGKNYTPFPIMRTNIWVYYPNTTVYLLIHVGTNENKYGFSVYAMQTFTRKIYPMTTDVLYSLGNLLTDSSIVGEANVLPENWLFSQIKLNSDQYMNVVSINKGIIINDGLKNTYNYVDPEYCDFVYEGHVFDSTTQ
jgi:hypothetical protein